MLIFTPITKISFNIISTINEVAKNRNIKQSDVDFDLLGMQTLIQSGVHKDWTIIEKPLEKVFDEDTLRSNTLFVKQEYKLKLRPYMQNKFFENIKIEIALNKAKSKVVATFKKGSVFPCDKNLAKLLKKEINHRKLRIGLLIGHFEGTLNSTLIKLSKVIKCNTPLQKDLRITIASSPGAVFSVDDSIILHYEKNEKKFIEGVDVNELIFEYIKPKKGIHGRSCNGNQITVSEPKVEFSQYKPDKETIETKEDENSVKYYSKVNGYVKNESGFISISKEVSIKSASFRGTGSISTGEDRDISINIHNENSSDDAVGSGVSIDVKELHVDGTVGSHANVKATDLSVGEQTHRNSQLEAVENAKIHLHRGNLKAKTAQIEILENGIVVADDVHVKKMLGGEIVGKRIIVEELASNTTIIASESIEIYTISGQHNKLIINPDKIESYHEKAEALKEEIKIKKTLLAETKKQHEKDLSEHNKQLDRIKVFQKRVINAIKAEKAPNRTDVIRVKQYKNEAEKLKNKAALIADEENEIIQTSTELEKLYEAELHAKIVNKSRYDGHTQVIFVDVKTSQEYTMLPEGVYKELFLKKDGDDKKISW
ncbi:DUF342 domain-containing protein [Candidatus Sulfurimonas marisnigri]|uniref:DUF342 domain-containing protein n=1 Tax=Candidatus Sulfurimonas marisnigri TaxID=2740405 RepID=A0A7S7RP62_9BACT|nr:flagellar assembly protein A [Candidatus Sulfurimonas marisnigri]QOY54042.1 DUF342 domain-containing protein [Candidatus Sulfurimonas marisnigri]